MKFDVENITAFDNDNGKGILASVFIALDDGPIPDVRVSVTLPLSRNDSLQNIEDQAVQAAKDILKNIVGNID